MRRPISRDGVTYIRLEFEEQPIDDKPLWRPRSAQNSGKSLGDPPEKSIPIWVWGLLKTQPWTAKDLAWELACAVETVYQAIAQLRRRGHTITQHRRKYYLEDDLPLRVVGLSSGRLRLARLRPGADFDITELP